jgi:hypothetical protein
MGSTQFYVVSDNLFGVFVGDLRNVGARVGLNFTFKRTVKEDLAREKRVDPETLPIENH